MSPAGPLCRCHPRCARCCWAWAGPDSWSACCSGHSFEFPTEHPVSTPKQHALGPPPVLSTVTHSSTLALLICHLNRRLSRRTRTLPCASTIVYMLTIVEESEIMNSEQVPHALVHFCTRDLPRRAITNLLPRPKHGHACSSGGSRCNMPRAATRTFGLNMRNCSISSGPTIQHWCAAMDSRALPTCAAHSPASRRQWQATLPRIAMAASSILLTAPAARRLRISVTAPQTSASPRGICHLVTDVCSPSGLKAACPSARAPSPHATRGVCALAKFAAAVPLSVVCTCCSRPLPLYAASSSGLSMLSAVDRMCTICQARSLL